MLKYRQLILHGIIHLTLFIIFIFAYEKHSATLIAEEMEYHSRAVANALWDLNMLRISEYLELYAQNNDCLSIEIHDSFSQKAIGKASGPDQTGLSLLFIRMGIIGIREYQAPVYYDDKLIGELHQSRYHKNIYIILLVLLILSLTYLIVLLIHNLLRARDELEIKVNERTADLQREVRSRRKAEEDLAVVLNSIGDAVIATDVKGLILNMNPTAATLSGWSVEEALGKSMDEVFPLQDANTDEKITHPIQKILESENTVNLMTKPFLLSRSEESYRISESGSPVLSVQNKIIGVVIVFRNVSEEYELQKKLQQNQKMEALGQLAGGIAHDFNNLLSGIISGSDLIGLELEKNDKAAELNRMVIDTAFRAGDLIKKLLAFARETPPVTGTVELNGIISDSIAMLKRTINKNIRIHEIQTDETLNVRGDTSQLQSVIMNLCINASHAMPEGGDLYLRSASVLLDEKYCQLSSFDLKQGPYSELIVEDTGIGIPKRIMERIFDPFFTTKERGKGTGLGLSAAYGTITQFGGELKVYSEEGKGSSFHIFLPLEKGPNNKQDAPQLQGYMKGSGKILVVDDEEIIRVTSQALLEHMGYEVVTAEDGQDALAKVDDSIDLVVLDMNMPVMDGKTCYYKLRETNPELPIIVASGFSQQTVWPELAENHADGFVVKPYKAVELGQMIHAIFNKRQDLNEE